MSLTICVGPNGSGKSLWALHQLEKFAVEDTRHIVTSLAVDVPELNAYLQQKYKDRAPDLTNRITRIGPELQRTFWRVRGSEYSDSEYGMVPIVRGPFGDESWRVPDAGVIFILDEIQTTFGAREWQQTGPEFSRYQSQHRKLGDDVIAISPASTLLDKQFRILATECVALSNLYKMRVGFWKAPRKIVYRLYQNCPPVPGEDPTEKGSIHIEPQRLARCYRTQDGLGIVGAQADKGKEAKGVPWFYMLPLALLLGFLAWFVARTITNKGVAWGIAKTTVSSVQTNSVVTNAVARVMPGFGFSTTAPPAPALAPALPRAPTAGAAPTKLPEAYGWGRAGQLVVLDTDAGPVYGSRLQEQGSKLVLDGEVYRKALRPKAH